MADDREIFIKQFVKQRTSRARLRHTLAADAEVGSMMPQWRVEAMSKFDNEGAKPFDSDTAAYLTERPALVIGHTHE
jgi:hypothetical protein